MQRYSFQSNSIDLSYCEWGNVDDPAIICVHGLTGNAQDFKFAGDYFSKLDYRVLAIDMPGRGKSSFLTPADYNFDTYVSCLEDFITHVKIKSCIWLGVSMGGLLGIRMSAKENSKIGKLILVDVGPEVPQSQLDFISNYLTYAPVFETIEGVVGAMKQSIGTPFYRGPMTEEQWTFFAESSMKKQDDGRFIRSFDPNIADNFKTQPLGKTDLWDEWAKIEQPVLAVRGELSLLFPIDVVNKMKARKNGNAMDFAEIKDAGHVPSFYPEEQLDILKSWLQDQQ